MSDINLTRTHSVSVAIAKERVQRAVDKLAAEYNVRAVWNGDTLQFVRPGLQGEIYVTSSEIRLEANLGLLMKPLKQKLIDRIQDEFEGLFPTARAGTQGKKKSRDGAPTAAHTREE